MADGKRRLRKKVKGVFSVEHLSMTQLFALEFFLVILAVLGAFCIAIRFTHPAY